MKTVSRCINLAFTINPYILQYVLRQIAPLTDTLGKFAAQPRILNAGGCERVMKPSCGKIVVYGNFWCK